MDTLPVLVQNDRDRRALDWLIQQVGQAAISQAAQQLAGQRKPYVSNIAKVLGLTLPTTIVQTPAADARQHLANLRALLQKS